MVDCVSWNRLGVVSTVADRGGCRAARQASRSTEVSSIEQPCLETAGKVNRKVVSCLSRFYNYFVSCSLLSSVTVAMLSLRLFVSLQSGQIQNSIQRMKFLLLHHGHHEQLRHYSPGESFHSQLGHKAWRRRKSLPKDSDDRIVFLREDSVGLPARHESQAENKHFY